jgi:hypothetical protein
VLHATAKNKTKLYERYLGFKELGDVRNCKAEDEITSTIIGPMDFMSSDEIHRFWSELFRVVARDDILPKHPPTYMEILLWPKGEDHSGTGKSIEPDATIEFIWSDGVRRFLLIELKWHAKLSGENQLHRQWMGYLTDEERKSAFHLFIAPTITEGASAKTSDLGNVWIDGDRLVLIPWETFRCTLNCITDYDGVSTALGRWSSFSDKFLKCIGIKRFVGFSHLTDELRFLHQPLTPLFWKPFQGFKLDNIPAEITTLSLKTILFQRDYTL